MVELMVVCLKACKVNSLATQEVLPEVLVAALDPTLK
jgi:hypothetical protein